MKSNLTIFLVGGAVRDIQLGLTPKDKDYVVVGSTISEMLDLGFTQVGKDFPVFLHPETNEEYALARTELKSGIGHLGFDVTTLNISLEQDLYRRDITINSMAINLKTNELIDPFDGLDDLKNKIIRHTSSHFSEDPLRVLRVIRFKSNYNFQIHESTIELIQSIPSSELQSIHTNRILKELYKLNNTGSLKNFLITIKELNLFEILFPYVKYNQINMDLLESLSKNNDLIHLALPFIFYKGDINALEKIHFLDSNQSKLAKLLKKSVENEWSILFLIELINQYRLNSNIDLLSNFCQFCNYSSINLCSFNMVLNAINSVTFTKSELMSTLNIKEYKTQKILSFLKKELE